jgi:hypothetical protein
MAQNGKDTSGNAFKYSMIPLLIGCAVIFFLYRSCGNSVFENQKPLSSEFVLTPEEKAAEAAAKEAAEAPAVEEAAPAADAAVETEVAKDSLQ